MKNNIIISTILASVALTSCSDDFLNLTSPNQLTIEEYYNSEARIYEALVAAYDPLQWYDYSSGEYNPLFTMSDIMADDVWVGGQDRSDNKYWHLMANYEALPTQVMTNVWITSYSGVNRCNNVIHYMDYVEDISDEKRKLYIAEARVLRSLYYTQLWKFWGNIPFFHENLEYPYIGKQEKADDVYSKIIADLSTAIEEGGLPMKQESEDMYGRVTLAMAYMLYTEVVMYQKDETRYEKALEYMNSIITSQKYDLMINYADIWGKEGEWCMESIWEINYMNEGAVRSWGSPMAAGGTVLPRLISPKDWNDGTENVDNGWGFEPVRAETYAMYEATDSRRDATIFDASAFKYTKRYQDTGYFLGKYIARTGYNEGHNADADLNYGNNLRVYRFSETLLYAAELLARGTSGEGDAETYLNRVHNRSGMTNTVQPTVDNIIKERRLEFVGEGKRYWDLIRTGKAESTLVPDEYGYRTNNWTQSKKYLPIPQSEIDADPALIQNQY